MDLINIIEAIEDERYLKPSFKDLSTWHAWLVFLKALFTIPFTDKKERKLYTKCTGRRRPPVIPAKEAYIIVSRRGGKSFCMAILIVFLAVFKEWTEYLAPGERGHIMILAVDKRQAGVIKGYISGILHSNKKFESLIERETSEVIDLTNSVSIMVKTASFRSVRGYTILACVLDEIAFFRSEESANPDREILTALRPGLATIPNSLCISISSPYSKSGVLWEAYSSYFGSSERTAPLVWQAPSLLMNPTLNKQIIKTELKKDYAAGKAEWLGEFREDLEQIFSLELLQAAVIEGRTELLPMKGTQYFSYTDLSSGRIDSATLAITHNSNGKIILDFLKESRPPFSPNEIIKDFSDILKSYGIGHVTGDRYAIGFVASGFMDNGIMFENSELTTSEIYLNFLPYLSNNAVELLDSRRLVSQFRGLERRVRPGGKDLVTHYPGGHDDLCCSCAGASLLASQTSKDSLSEITMELAKNENEFLSPEEKESKRITSWLMGGELEPPPYENKKVELDKKPCLTISEWLTRSKVPKRGGGN